MSNNNNIYSTKKRIAPEDSPSDNSKHQRLGIAIPQPFGLRPFPTPSISDDYSTPQTLSIKDVESFKPIDALEASTILRSFVNRGSQLDHPNYYSSLPNSLNPAAALSLYLPPPNSKWRIPIDSPDSLPTSFLIPSPRSSTRSDASDLSHITHIPAKALSNLLSKENDLLISSNYARSLSIRENQIRTDMVNWIFDIAQKLAYLPETGYIAVNFFDRYFSENNVRTLKQQKLLALTCVFIAGKIHEELSEPLISEMLAFTGTLFDANDLKKMERKVVGFFEWNLSCVTPLAILDEAFHSIGYPEAKKCSPASTYNTTRAHIERLLNPLLPKILRRADFCSVRSSILLRTCLEFLEFHRNVGRVGIDILQIALLLPPVDEDLRAQVFSALE